MNLRRIYLILCFVGVILPFSQLIPWAMVNGINLSLFFHELFSTRIGSFFGLDVVVSAVVLLIFIISESQRLHIANFWWTILATLLVGVSLGFPLFLYMRQVEIEKRLKKVTASVHH